MNNYNLSEQIEIEMFVSSETLKTAFLFPIQHDFNTIAFLGNDSMIYVNSYHNCKGQTMLYIYLNFKRRNIFTI